VSPTLLPIVAFFAITVFAGALALVLRDLSGRSPNTVEQRLDMGQPARLPRLRLEAEQNGARGLADRFDHWFSLLIEQTGVALTPQAAFLLMITVGLLSGGALFLWRDNIMLGVASALVGMLLVMGVFVYLRGRRQRAIWEQFPGSIELMARAIRAGESLDQAIEMVGDNVAEPLATEFQRFAGQLKMGLSINAAVRAFTRRVPLAESRFLAASLVVQRRAGGNLPVTLERLAKVCRDRLNYYRQFRAMTATGRGSAIMIIVTTLAATAFMWFWGPDYAQFRVDSDGQAIEYYSTAYTMMAVAIGLQIVGLIWIYRILKTDY
jgi:tight adherence protein B